MNKLIPLLAFSILLLVPVSQSAFAAEVIFDTTGILEPQTLSISYIESGVTMTATGTADDIPTNVVQTVSGVGVVAPGDSSFSIDDTGPDETLFLTFDQEVRILEITFSEVGEDSANDDYTLLIDGVEIRTISVANPGMSSFTDHLTLDLDDATRTGTVFGIATGFPASGGFDEFKIVEVIIETLENEQNQVIGGEIIPIEQTSLLLAGAQSFSWMIPLVISSIGIGIFVVSRKS